MRVVALGHAGLQLNTSRAALLFDPWFSPEGAFQASWFQFPENSHLLTPALCAPSAIVISHEHLDHVDPWFLAQVPAHVPAVIPRYPSPALKRKILSAGPRPIVEASQWEKIEVADGITVFFVSEPPQNHDSAIVVQAEGKVLLNMNDARMFPMQLREIQRRTGGTIDLITYQGAGASWYPICYDYAPQLRQELSRRKRFAKLAYCRTALSTVNAVACAPFAGPPAFLDTELFRFNEEMEGGIFPHQQHVADWLRQHGISNNVVLLPGDAWDLTARKKDADPYWQGFSFDDLPQYLASYAARRRPQIETVISRHPQPTSGLWGAFENYFQNLLAMSPYFNRRINMAVGFDIRGPGGGQWNVDFRAGSEGVRPALESCNYVYRFDSRWLPPLLDGRVAWEDFFLSLRMEASRHPDVYNDHLLALLKFAHRDALDAVETFETADASDERITVHSEGRQYSISRYCPHARADLLQTGEVLPGGVLQCLAHHYTFDLKSGQCLNGTCTPLSVQAAECDETVESVAEPGATHAASPARST